MTAHWTDRRQSRRRRLVEDHGVLLVHIRPGRQALLVDISADGALIETAHRLLPGRAVELHVERAESRASVRGRLLRCTVVRLLPSAVCYRGAIAFEHRLPWLVDDSLRGYGVPGGETPQERPARVGTTRQTL